MCFLDTLTMITLRVRQTEQAFLQEVAVLQSDSIAGGGRPTTFKQRLDLLFAIPERKGNVLYTMCIRYTCNSIFTPTESSRSCMIVGEVAPGVAICTVILSDYTMTNPALACCFSIRYVFQSSHLWPTASPPIPIQELLALLICMFPSHPRPRLTTYGPQRCFWSVSKNFLELVQKLDRSLPSNTWFSRGLPLGASLPL